MLHSVATAFATRVFPVPTGQQPSHFTPGMCSLVPRAMAFPLSHDRARPEQTDTAVATKLCKFTGYPARTFWLDTLASLKAKAKSTFVLTVKALSQKAFWVEPAETLHAQTHICAVKTALAPRKNLCWFDV